MTRVLIDGEMNIETLIQNPGVNSWLQGLNNGSDGLGKLGEVHEGYGSIGVGLSGADIFLRVPKSSDDRSPIQVLQSINLAMVPDQISLGVLVKVENEEIVKSVDGDLRSLDDEILVILHVLELMPVGVELDDLVEIKEDELREVYGKIGENIGQVHSSEVGFIDDVDQWREISTRDIVTGHERFDAICRIISSFKDQSWVNHDQLGRIRKKMIQLSERQLSDEVELVRSHGDLWEANVRVTKESGEVVLFDQSLGYAPAGLDIGFMMGKQLIAWLVKGEESSKNMIEAFLDGYESSGGDRSKALEEVFNPLAFKMVVGAAFDEYDEDVRIKLVDFTEKLLNAKLENPDLEFSLELAKKIWNIGKLTNRQVAEICFPDEGVVMTNNNLEGEIRPILKVLEGLKLTNDQAGAVNLLFSQDGEWQYSMENMELYGMEVEKLTETLELILGPIYNLANILVDNGFEHGFNSHGWENHISQVMKNGLALMKQVEATEEERVNGMIALVGHDLGNILNRKGHNYSSVRILEKVLPELVEDQERWNKIKTAIEFHEFKEIGQTLDVLINRVLLGEVFFKEALLEIREKFGIEGLALVVADKTDISPMRMNEQVDLRSLKNDVHFRINMLGRTIFVGWKNAAEFTWNLGFSPLAKSTRDLYRERGINQFDIWRNELIITYYERIRLMLVCAAALNFNTGVFKISFFDRNGNSSGVNGDEFVSRFDLDGILDLFQKDKRWARKYVPKGTRKDWKY